MESLKEYDKITKNLLKKMVTGKSLKFYLDSQIFGELVNAVITADNTFDPERSALQTWRINRLKWKMLDIYNDSNMKERVISDNIELNNPDGHSGANATLFFSDIVAYDKFKQKKFIDEGRDLLDNMLRATPLTKKQKEIIQLKFFDRVKTKNITEQLGVTRQYVSLTIREAIERIRKANGITVGDQKIHTDELLEDVGSGTGE